MMAAPPRPRQVPSDEQPQSWAPASHQPGRDMSMAGHASNNYAFDAASSGNYGIAGPLDPNSFLMDQAPTFGDTSLMTSHFSSPDLALDTNLQPMDFPRSETDEPWTGMQYIAPLPQTYPPKQPYYQPSMSNAGSHSQYEYALSDTGEYGAPFNETTPITSQHSIGLSETEDELPHHGYANPMHTQSSKAASVTSAATSHSNKRKLSELFCETCEQQCRNESEYKKHKARHDKMHTCPVPECENGTNGKGFTTPNDLERHMSSKHRIFLPDTKVKVYICQAKGCEGKKKLWPRYDNFKQHIERMHDPAEVDEIIARSKINAPVTEESHRYKQILDDRAAAHVRSESISTASSMHQPTDTMTGPKPSRNALSRSGSAKAARSSASLHPSPAADKASQYLCIPRTRRKSEASSTASNSRATSPAAHAPYRNRSATVGNTKPHLQQMITRGISPSTPGIVVSLSPNEHTPQEGSRSPSYGFSPVSAGVKVFYGASQPQAHGSTWPQPSQNATLDPSLLDADGDPEVDEPVSPMTVARAHSSHQVQCPHQGCEKAFTRECDLKKHTKRHERPFGCTYDGCDKAFGSKNDWKRHENGQHFQQETWRCPLPGHGARSHGHRAASAAAKQCAQLFDDVKDFRKHILGVHGSRTQGELNDLFEQSHIGANGQQSFWCGFCREIVRLREMDLKAWDERFNHIGDHFKQDHIDNWLICGGHRTKGQVRQGAPASTPLDTYGPLDGTLSSAAASSMAGARTDSAERIVVADGPAGYIAITCCVCLNGPFSDLHASCPHCGARF